VILNGFLKSLRYSKRKVCIVTKNGAVDCFLSETIAPDEISPFRGKEVTITGKVHHRSDKKPVVEIERVFKAAEGDQYFSKIPKSETVEQQIRRRLAEQGYKNRLSEIVGKWPGDETDDEFEKLMKMLTK
jgi:hypothetical protein